VGRDGVHKNRERPIEGDIAQKFIAAVLNQRSLNALLSDDHFSVDGTLIEAWESFRPKDGNGEPPAPARNSLPRAIEGQGKRDFHGEKRSKETHASTTDPMPGCTVRGRANRPSLPIWGTC
jgi:hypothetical protein